MLRNPSQLIQQKNLDGNDKLLLMHRWATMTLRQPIKEIDFGFKRYLLLVFHHYRIVWNIHMHMKFELVQIFEYISEGGYKDHNYI